MANKTQVFAMAAELGCDIVDDYYSICITPPSGMLLAAFENHITDWAYGDDANALTKAQAWDFCLEDMSDGIKPCQDAKANGGPGCNTCDEIPLQEGIDE